MTCLLKRALPFLLTLLVGTALSSWLSPNSSRTCRSRRDASEWRAVDSSRSFAPSDYWTWAIIKKQPIVEYTQAARQDHVTGTVRLRVLLDANGTVSKVVPVQTLPDGLTEAAIDAAWQTTFIPATKMGRPISVWIEFDHEFRGDGVLSYARNDVYEEVHTQAER